MRQLDAILDRHYGEDTSGIKDIILEAAQVVRDPSSKLGHAFNTIERVGYMRTGLRSALHVIEGTAPDCQEGLRWLAADVLSNHPAVLIERSAIYMPVRAYLYHQRYLITSAFGIVSPHTFTSNYPEEQQATKEAAFKTNQQAWTEWLAS
jgi:hypothetical protein